jgi:hypothetical protein
MLAFVMLSLALAANPVDAGVVDAIGGLVDKHYVFPEKRAAIVQALRSGQSAGRYDVQGAELGARLTDDLVAASHDKHLWVEWSPERFEARRAARPGLESTPYEDALGERRNQGYEEMRILDGNLRYVRLTGFIWRTGRTPAVVADAARFLGGGDALVIDLRGNGGGSGQAVQALISYFLPPRHQLLMTFFDGMTGKREESRVLGRLPAPRLLGKPLYVLVDGRTASAAEEFADHVKEFKLGTLVGQTTAGGANNDTLFPVPPGFIVSISTGRPVDAVSKTNWEGVGVAPDVDSPSAAALDRAALLALRELASHADGPRRGEYEWAIVGPQSRLEPQTPTPEQLQSYAGQYGIRKVRVEHGALVFQREEREPTVLIPLTPDVFQFSSNPGMRLRFRRRGGQVSGFEMFTREGGTIPVERTG